MKTSEYAISKIKEFEGLRLKAYKPVATEKNYTIGYGHCGADVGKTQCINESYATFLLKRDLDRVERFINGMGLCLTQKQFDALVDFAFNCGTTALANSTLLKRVRLKTSERAIVDQFMLWVNAGSKKLPGLLKRRAWESQMWSQKAFKEWCEDQSSITIKALGI